MILAALIPLALKASIALIVFAVGLNATLRDATHLFRQPGQLVRLVVAMNVVMPALAVALALAFDLHPAVKIALVALAVSPVPSVLPNKALKAGGAADYTIDLLVAASLLAIVFVPLSIELCERVFATPLEMPAAEVAKQVGVGVQEHLVEHPRDLGQVQAAEIRVKTQGGLGWMALALMGKTRLWLAGEVSAHRAMPLLRRCIERVCRCAAHRPLLLGTDGVSSYVRARRETLRDPVRPGARGALGGAPGAIPTARQS